MQRVLQHPSGPRYVHLAGWKKQLNDPRDAGYSIKLHRSLLSAHPSSADNRSMCSAVEDQGELGSCTANMFAALVEANENRRLSKLGNMVSASGTPTVTVGTPTVNADGSINFSMKVVPAASPAPTPTPAKMVQVSRLFTYYSTRKIEGTVNEDSGATIRDAVKSGVLYGVADEATYPYDVKKFALNPPKAIWDAAATHKVTSYHSIADGDLETMKTVLSGATPYLIGFGFAVYDSFMGADVAKSGLVTKPLKSESLQGGHAVALVGYDDNKMMPDGSKGAFLVRNSWGTGWGINGYFWMSYDYVGDVSLANDFWVIQSAPVLAGDGRWRI